MSQFLGLMLFLIIVALLLQLDFVFYIVYVGVGIYVWSRWLLPRSFHNLTVTRHFGKNAFLGESVPITLNIKNPGLLPLPWLQFSESVAPELRMSRAMSQVFSLRSRATTTRLYQIKAARRGYYQIGPLRLTTSDPFGMMPEQTMMISPDYLTVYPRITPLNRLGLPSRLPFGTLPSTQRLFADPARPTGVREFRSGDSLRQINWKVSAHTRDLMVKRLQPAISLETAVCLNLHRPAYYQRHWKGTTEWAIEVAASLAAHLIKRRQAVGLLCNGLDPLASQTEELAFDEASGRLNLAQKETEEAGILPFMPPPIPPRNGRAHLMKVLEQLARIEAGSTIPLTEWLAAAGIGLSWGTTLLVLTPQGDEATCQMLHRLARSGFNPVLLVVEPDYNFDQVQKRAKQLGFAAYHVAAMGDLDRWRRPLAA